MDTDQRPDAEIAHAESGVESFDWLGATCAHLDAPHIDRRGPVVIGVYGGNTTAGATKNEDAARVWRSSRGEWEFAAGGRDSATLIAWAYENSLPASQPSA